MTYLHTMIRVKDAEASLKFYIGLFGMKLDSMKKLNDCWLYFLADENGTPVLELTENDVIPPEGYSLGTAFGHLAFGVKSMDEFTEKMSSLGYEYLYEPFDLTGRGSNIAFLKDPDGYEIEVIEKVNW